VVLTEASALASVAVLPYVLSLRKDALAAAAAQRVARGKRPLLTPSIAALAFVQGQVTFGAVAAVGLRAGRAMDLGAPYLKARLAGRPAALPVARIGTYAAVGVGAALGLLALDRTLFSGVRARLEAAGVREPGVWQGLLATLYGGIAEEVLMRLGLQTLLAAGIRRVRGETARPPGGATMWPAIALSNLAFGAGHLPALRGLLPLTPAVVARTVTLNVGAGVPFGYLYWTRSLEAGMIAHGAADLVLHVGGALAQTGRVAGRPQ
jgi:membrane protease YdiL (CAAX protease family)